MEEVSLVIKVLISIFVRKSFLKSENILFVPQTCIKAKVKSFPQSLLTEAISVVINFFVINFLILFTSVKVLKKQYTIRATGLQ